MFRPSHGWCSGILRSYWILSVYHTSSFSTITSFNSPVCILIHLHLKMFRLHVKHPRKEARETHMRALAWTVGIYGAYREYSFILREGKGTDVSRFGKCYALDIINEMSKKKKLYWELIFVLPRKVINKWLRMIGNQYYLGGLKVL